MVKKNSKMMKVVKSKPRRGQTGRCSRCRQSTALPRMVPVETKPDSNANPGRRPWDEELAHETMDDENDARFARYTRDLVRGLETIKKYPQGVTIFGSARFHPTNKYYLAAYELGAKLAQHNHTVTTGGGPGIMEAANRGAFENHGRSVGLNIHLSTEQDLNPWTTDSMEFHYFFARKVMLTFSSKMYVFFPGGFGTMDEFAEVLELVHTGKMPHAPIILFGREFWRGLDEWFGGKMSEWHLIETGDPNEINEMAHVTAADFGLVKNARNLYYITDDVDEIVKIADETDPHDVQQLFDQVSDCQLFGICK